MTTLKSIFDYVSFSKAKASIAKTGEDIKSCVSADLFECQSAEGIDEKVSYQDFLYLPPFNEVMKSSCISDNRNSISLTNTTNTTMSLEQPYCDVAKDQLFMQHLLENPILINAYKEKTDLFSMNLCSILRKENLKLVVLNSELESRLLTLSAEVIDTNVQLQDSQLEYLKKQRELQKDVMRIQTSRKLLDSMKNSIESEVENLRRDKLNIMKALKLKSEELHSVNFHNQKLQAKLDFAKKVVDTAKEDDLSLTTSELPSADLSDKKELVLEIEKLMKSKAVLRNLNDVIVEELNKTKSDNEDLNSKLMTLANQLLAVNTELDIEREKVKALEAHREILPETKVELEEKQIQETLIEGIINNIASTLSLRTPDKCI